MTDRQAKALLAVSLFLLGIFAVAAFVPGSSPPSHPTIPEMQVGVAPELPTFVLAGAFLLGEIVLFSSFFAAGFRRRQTLGRYRAWVLGGTIAYGAVGASLFAVQRLTPEAIVFSLPAPTALLLFGLWPVPVVFGALYVVTFDRWTFTDDDERRISALGPETSRSNPGGAP